MDKRFFFSTVKSVKYLLIVILAVLSLANISIRKTSIGTIDSHSLSLVLTTDNTTKIDEYWPSLRHVLCGKKSPNLMLSRLIFRIARTEAFQHNKTILNKIFKNADGGPTNTLTSFFVGSWGTSIYRDSNNLNLTTAYVKLWKCANNQIRWMEKKLWLKRNGTYIGEMSLPYALGHYLYSRNEKDGMYRYKPFIHKNAIATTVQTPQSVENVTEAIAQPCLYTAVRDPISHFLSGFNEVETRILGEYNNKTVKNQFALAPYHKKVPYSNSSGNLRRRRFLAFVEDLLLEDDAFSKHYIYSHFFSMSRILPILSSYNLSLTGYIPSLENISSTWPEFISSTCTGAPSLENIPKMTIQGQHRSSNDRLLMYKAAKDVWNFRGPIARALCILHSYDYACWENLPDGIPDICLEVYGKHARRMIEYGSKNYYSYDY